MSFAQEFLNSAVCVYFLESSKGIPTSTNKVNFFHFQNVFITVLHKHGERKKRTDTNLANYGQQQDFCVTLLSKTKKDFFQNLVLKNN